MIGVFDSGLGGLTVLRELTARFKHADFVYLADHAHVPYGNRPSDEIVDLTRAATEDLFRRGAKLVLLGCNTATAVALRRLQQQWLPNTACSVVANQHGLYGPRLCHSTACASGVVDFLSAVRAIRDEQCDIALAGSGEAIHPLFAAGFQQMRVLANHDDPKRACRPFDSTRDGFVMGEGAAMFVLERLSHALERKARIYAEVVAGKTLADAHHVTGVDLGSDTLAYLISITLDAGQLAPSNIGYINAHGTGTQQNDVAESRAIRTAMGGAADQLCVSATKSMLGHLVNAAGSVELAITTLAMRDGFVPPTLNLTAPDPQCDLDCIPLVGRANRFVCALKLSVAFGGHLAAVALRRWDDDESGFAYPRRSLAA